MLEINSDVTVIGGGIAGLAAAISAKKSGLNEVIVIDRNSWIGGILPQCIHDGFGIEETGESLTGPEYIDNYIKKARELNIRFFQGTMVLDFNKKHEIRAVSKKGLFKIKSKSIIISTGCREKTRGNLMIPGHRPSGIYTAGLAQTLINLDNIQIGKNVVILGSGDIGLIMARRMKIEGGNVLGVIEKLSYAGGLPRNVVQCLIDYDIPLFLNHTVTRIEGRDRLERIILTKLNKNGEKIKNSEFEIKCDTLLLSVGLIPENELSREAGIKIDKLTSGPIVNQDFETNLSGIYACGNCLQVYDTVDLLSNHAKKVGKKSAEKILCKQKNKKKSGEINVKTGHGIKYIIPQKITKPGLTTFSIKIKEPTEFTVIAFKLNGNEIYRKKLKYLNPANIIDIKFEIPFFNENKKNNIEVNLHER